MIQNYMMEGEYNPTQDKLWDDYLDKQLSHVVLEYEFDFEKIAQTLKNMKYKKTENYINK